MRTLLGCVLALALVGCQQDKTQDGKATTTAAPAASGAQPQTDEQKALYALGMSVARQISVFDLSAQDLEFVKAGLEAKVLGKEPAVELEQYAPKLNELARTRSAARAEKEKEKAKAFLEQAAKEKGAVVTESGLVFISQQEGTGESPVATDRVTVHYRGTLTDGTEFDSSHKRGQPATFPLNGVIPCWQEGVAKMKKGGKAKLVCPSTIAYGDRGTPNIPGGAALVFEVELIDIAKAGQQPAAQQQPQPPPQPPQPKK
ncbi:MAG: FKBP-type peptidyl-prolyl cis-trans isomerase [Myxococcaceae bacterium]